MYSIVMLSAMSAGADVTPPPAIQVPMVVAMGTGCGGVMPSGCYGSSCYGSSCHGSSCHGGGYVAKRGGFLGHRTSCHGSCYGSSCYGSSCHGSCSGYTCFGSCHGCSGVGYGSSWGPPVGMPPYTLHGYNSAVEPVYGPGFPVVLGSNYTDPHMVYGSTFSPNRPPVVVIPVAPIPKATSDSQTGANLKFTVPASTKLFVDGKPVAGSGTDRAFYTPPLAVGQKFFYDVKAELVVDGKLVVEEKRVIVEAGANLTETFPKLVAATAVAGK